MNHSGTGSWIQDPVADETGWILTATYVNSECDALLEAQFMPTLIDRIFRQNLEEPEIPICPDHKVEMRLRGKLGKPTRFQDQTESEYTLIYFCPVEECNETAERVVVRTQIPVPGDAPERPSFSRPGEANSL